jgi:NitT/TauT family transport system permease protein
MQYDKLSAFRLKAPNIFDFIAAIIIFSVFSVLALSASEMVTPYQLGEPIKIVFTYQALVHYSFRTLLRMVLAMCLSVCMTLILGCLMAKNHRCRKVLLPIIDILQSVPPLGVMAFIYVSCVKLFPGSLLGLELASIITTFFSQVWNMILSFYQSIITIPSELEEAVQIYRLSAWQRFWKLEVPRATPGLVLNAMVSMSASWFFVVASEAISIANQNIILPGVGSFLSEAIAQQHTSAVGMAFIAMFFIILIYDQLLFRPLLAWSEKFKEEIEDDGIYNTSWFFDLLSRTQFLSTLKIFLNEIYNKMPKISFRKKPIKKKSFQSNLYKILSTLTELVFYMSLVYGVIKFFLYCYFTFKIVQVIHALKLGAITATKVIIVVLSASLLWIPIGVIIGSNTKLAVRSQPIIQFLASCPPQMLYPMICAMIIKYNLNVDIWTTPIMIFGTQWYILFNVIAGSMMITKDQRLVAANFGLKGWLLWRRLYLPAVMPYCITGCMAAAGGCWNVSISTDTVAWGSTKLEALGISSYINQGIDQGNFDQIILGMAVMSFYVIIINRLVWNPLFEKVSAYR